MQWLKWASLVLAELPWQGYNYGLICPRNVHPALRWVNRRHFTNNSNNLALHNDGLDEEVEIRSKNVKIHEPSVCHVCLKNGQEQIRISCMKLRQWNVLGITNRSWKKTYIYILYQRKEKKLIFFFIVLSRQNNYVHLFLSLQHPVPMFCTLRLVQEEKKSFWSFSSLWHCLISSTKSILFGYQAEKGTDTHLIWFRKWDSNSCLLDERPSCEPPLWFSPPLMLFY